MKRLVCKTIVIGILAGWAFILSGCVAFVPMIDTDYQGKQGLFGPVAAESCPLPETQLNAQPVALTPSPNRVAPKNTRNDQLAEAEAFVAAHVPAKRKGRVDKRQARLKTLIKQLNADTAVARTHAASDIGFMGPYAVSAIRPLSVTLKHDDSKWVRRAAAKSLGKIGTADVVVPLRGALSDRNKWVAHSAGNALRRVERKLGYSRQRYSKPTNVRPVYNRPDFNRPTGKSPVFRARGNKVQKL